MACRFCLLEEESKQDPLWTPCKCKGSVKYIHKQCLIEWLKVAPEQHRYYCQLCLTHYVFPRLWSRETYPYTYLPGERVMIFNPAIIITIVIFLYSMYYIYYININTIQIDTEYIVSVLSPHQFYLNMLFAVTMLYGIYFIRRFLSVRNKMIYIAYMCIPFTVHQPIVTVISAGLIISFTNILMIPIGLLYIILLSRMLREHEVVIRRMNADAHNVILM